MTTSLPADLPPVPDEDATSLDADADALEPGAPAAVTVSGDLETAGEDPARKRLLDRVCLGGIALHVLIRTVCSFMRAYLIANPLVYVFLVASPTAMITAGAFARVGRLPLELVVPATLFGLAAFDFFYFWAGRRFRHRLHQDLSKVFGIPDKWLGRAERWMARFGSGLLLVRFFQPVPNQLLQLFAGSGGMRLWRFLLVDLLGAALWGALMLWAGWSAGEAAVEVVDVIAAHALKVTIGLVVVSVVWNVLKAKRAAARS